MVRKAAPAAAAGSGNNTPVDSCQPQQLLVDAADGEPAPRYMIQFGPVMAPGGGGPAGAPGHAVAECSEAETASSGYSDEVSNKATQTDESPRNFLCTIADGKDWRFSIYEDESAIDSRFRFSPAHRELFREIFSVLRKAAENRDEGDQLPLLDDTKPAAATAAAAAMGLAGRGGTNPVPPVTPANEEPPCGFGLEEDDDEDDDQETVSFVSSSAVSEQSFAMSECITKSERRRIARQAKAASRYAEEEQPKAPDAVVPDDGTQSQHQQPQLEPNQPKAVGQTDGRAFHSQLDFIPVTIGVHKRKSRRRSHRREAQQAAAAAAAAGAGTTPQTPTPPRATGSTRKHRPSFRPWNPERDSGSIGLGTSFETWNGNSMTIYNRAVAKPGPAVAPVPNAAPPSSRTRRSGEKKRIPAGLRNRYADLMDDALGDDVVQFQPSTASQHLHKLQKLDLSYAEVLRRTDCGHPFPDRRQYGKQQQQQQQPPQ
uniref:Uncharacterized protein n=1 Tax=Anopheles dirus TaxID=7168 RepID=A0A182NSU7_9DIPT